MKPKMDKLVVNNTNVNNNQMRHGSPVSSSSSSQGKMNSNRDEEMEDTWKKVDDAQTFIRSRERTFEGEKEEQDLHNTIEVVNTEDYGSAEYYSNRFNSELMDNNYNYADNYNQGFNYSDLEDNERQTESNDEENVGIKSPKHQNINESNGSHKSLNENMLLEDFDSTNNLGVNENVVKNSDKISRKSGEKSSLISSIFGSFKIGGKKVDSTDARGPVRMNAFEESDEKSGCFKSCFKS